MVRATVVLCARDAQSPGGEGPERTGAVRAQGTTSENRQLSCGAPVRLVFTCTALVRFPENYLRTLPIITRHRNFIKKLPRVPAPPEPAVLMKQATPGLRRRTLMYHTERVIGFAPADYGND
jgi:hypothetical protein